MRGVRVILVALLALAASAAPAQATFPGANGGIAYSWEESDGETHQICSTVDSGPHLWDCLTSHQDLARDPAYSADGQRIAYWSELVDRLFTVNYDGTDDGGGSLQSAYNPGWSPTAIGRIVFQYPGSTLNSGPLATARSDFTDVQPLTTDPTDATPDWSPDGTQIAFTRTTGGNREIWMISPDTGQETRITNTPVSEFSPDFSPDGRKLVFSVGAGELHVMNANGTGRTALSLSGIAPVWSPDGQQIAYERSGAIYRANADGTGETLVPTETCCPAAAHSPDWRPLPVDTASTHVRPAGATPLQVSLVPAFEACTAPNRTHGPPLAFPACNPPQPGSPNLTVGVGDGDPALSRSVGSVRLGVLNGTPGGVDDTDVRVRFSLSNVMWTSDLSEYAGELDVRLGVRLTDREGTVAQTTQDFPFAFEVPCAPTAEPLDKSLCAALTSFDAITPGSAAEGTRAIWALGPVRVNDGGPDGDAGTRAGNAPFATQGVFVP